MDFIQEVAARKTKTDRPKDTRLSRIETKLDAVLGINDANDNAIYGKDSKKD